MLTLGEGSGKDPVYPCDSRSLPSTHRLNLDSRSTGRAVRDEGDPKDGSETGEASDPTRRLLAHVPLPAPVHSSSVGPGTEITCQG